MEATQSEFKTVRVHRALTADVEKRLLVWIARRLPPAIHSDHLTSAGFLALIGVGASFWAGGGALLLVIPLLVRQRERPRYGYYVDHVLDAAGFVALFGGLALGGHMTPLVALGFLTAYFLVVVEVSLATHARGTFRLSAWGVGPTELRVLLALGTLQLMRSDVVVAFGHRWLLFDVGGALGIAGLLLTFVRAAIANGAALYREERLP